MFTLDFFNLRLKTIVIYFHCNIFSLLHGYSEKSYFRVTYLKRAISFQIVFRISLEYFAKKYAHPLWREQMEQIEMTDHSKETAFNKPLVSSFIVPKLRKAVVEGPNDAFNGKQTSKYELEFITNFGEIRTFLVNATTRWGPEGKIIGAGRHRGGATRPHHYDPSSGITKRLMGYSFEEYSIIFAIQILTAFGIQHYFCHSDSCCTSHLWTS